MLNLSSMKRSPTPMSPTLRDRLAEITVNPRVQEHAALIEALRVGTSHSIAVQQSPYPLARYTCGVHAFHLVGKPAYERVATSGDSGTFAGTEFIEYLFKQKLMTPRPSEAAVLGDLVFYEGGQYPHVGLVTGPNRVLSKWGTGCLCQHAVWEVPTTYGNEVQYCVGLNEAASLALFLKYAASKGFTGV